MLLKKNIIFGLLLSSVLALTSSCSNDDSSVIIEDPVEFLGEVEFVNTFGGSGIDEAVDVVLSNDGNYVILGTTTSTDGDILDRNTNDRDIWILKISNTGEVLWSKTYGGSEDDVATALQTTADGGFIISAYSRSNDGDVSGNEGFHDFWILKLNSAGEMQWDKNFGFSGSDQALNIIETTDGGYFASGFLDVSASGGQGNDGRATQHGVGEFWGIKLDSSGNMIWRRYFGGSNNDRCYSTIETSDGGFLLAGASESDDFDITDSKGSYDFWVVKINDSGSLQWSKSFGGSEIDIAYDVIQTSDGNYMIAGDTRSNDQDISNSNGNADAWVVKFNDSGNMIWEKTLGGSGFESARSVLELSDGNYAFVASTRSEDGDVINNNGLNDAWVVVFDDSRNISFQKNIGGTGLDFANGIIETPNKELIIVGNTESDDVDISENKGGKDFLIIKIK